MSALLICVLSVTTQVVQASSTGEALAKSNNCLLCHGVDQKVMGPAYKDVAKSTKAIKQQKQH